MLYNGSNGSNGNPKINAFKTVYKNTIFSTESIEIYHNKLGYKRQIILPRFGDWMDRTYYNIILPPINSI
jgi:hypothetical protein